MADLTSLDAVLKNDYRGPIREQINQKTPALRRIRRKAADTVGKKLVIPLHKSRNTGIGARGEREALPGAGSQGYEDLQITPAYLYGVFDVTGPSIEASRNNRGAFIRAVSSEMKGLATDLKKDVNRQTFNFENGPLAVCGTTNGSTTVQLATTTNMNLFEEGMLVDIVAASTGSAVANGDGVEIQSVDVANSQITIDGSGVTTSASHIVVRSGSYGKEWLGFGAWVATADNTVGNIDRSSNKWFNPNVLGNSGVLRAPSLDLMQQAFDRADIKSGGNVSVGFFDHAQRRKYLALLRAERRFASTSGDGSAMTLDGGFKAVMYNGIPLIVDSQAIRHTIIFVDESSCSIYYNGPDNFDWMQRDGSILHRVSGKDLYEAVMFWYSQLVVDIPGACSALTDLSE